MKQKISFAFLLFIVVTQVQAQVTFRPGLRAGVNFSHFTEGDEYYSEDTNAEFTSKTDFYAGFYGALHLSRFYTLQPEVDYSRQGSVYQYTDDFGEDYSQKIDVSYLSIAVVNKFTFGEKFNVHIAPTMDFIVDKAKHLETESDVDFGFVAGLGFNFTKNIGIEARIKKGIVPVVDNGDYHTNVVFSLGAAYTFDIK